jgi:hypothetical protein
VVELLDAEREHGVVDAGLHHGARLVQRRRGAGAGVLDVHDRDRTHARRAQHHLAADALLPGDQPRHRVADEGRLDLLLVDAAVRQRREQGLAAQGLQSRVHVLAEARHADTGDYGSCHRISFSSSGVHRQRAP